MEGQQQWPSLNEVCSSTHDPVAANKSPPGPEATAHFFMRGTKSDPGGVVSKEKPARVSFLEANSNSSNNHLASPPTSVSDVPLVPMSHVSAPGQLRPTRSSNPDGQGWLPDSTSLAFTRSSSGGTARNMLKLKSVRSLKLNLCEKVQLINMIADHALAAFVQIQVELKRSRKLQQYAMREDLNVRLPGFNVQMGFGLHVGWAIEGAIGSEYKIDASYLSPNVNTASRLEAATKQFGTPILLSGDFVECLSPDVRNRVRQIDCVAVKGSKRPIDLYTYDLDLTCVTPSSVLSVCGDHQEASCPLDLEEFDNDWVENPDIAGTWGLTAQFKRDFDQGFQAYREGRWEEAKQVLMRCQYGRSDSQGLLVEDHPSRVLLEVMEENGFKSPPSWRGYRELTEK